MVGRAANGDVRGWPIAQGRALFEAAVADPDARADVPDLREGVECEAMPYLAHDAYRAVTGIEMTVMPAALPDLGDED